MESDWENAKKDKKLFNLPIFVLVFITNILYTPLLYNVIIEKQV